MAACVWPTSQGYIVILFFAIMAVQNLKLWPKHWIEDIGFASFFKLSVCCDDGASVGGVQKSAKRLQLMNNQRVLLLTQTELGILIFPVGCVKNFHYGISCKCDFLPLACLLIENQWSMNFSLQLGLYHIFSNSTMQRLWTLFKQVHTSAQKSGIENHFKPISYWQMVDWFFLST